MGPLVARLVAVLKEAAADADAAAAAAN